MIPKSTEHLGTLAAPAALHPQQEKVNEISVVVPVYQAADLVDELCRRVVDSLSAMEVPYELILVEDGSKDESWAAIRRNSGRYPRVRGIRLRRNFGQHSALLAGLAHSTGNWVVMMDCDLQDRPEEIPRLHAKAMEGNEAVWAVRRSRQDALSKRLTSRAFFWVLSQLTGRPIDARRSNFGIFHRSVIEAVVQLEESGPWVPELIRWSGVQEATIPVDHSARASGKSSYDLRRRLRFAVDIVVLSTDRPLRLTIAFGALLTVLAALYAAVTVVRALTGDIGVSGWSSLIVSIWFLSGLIISTLGVLGLYIGRIYGQSRRRPCYVIREQCHALEGEIP